MTEAGTNDTAREALPETAKPASAWVAAQHEAMLKALPFGDTADFDDAARGFLGTIENAKITSAQGRVVWSLEPYGFLSEAAAPATVNPSLWRQSRLNMHHGLFEVVPGVYQVRGLDIANMTLIEGDAGVIVVDTLTSIEGARAAIELYVQHAARGRWRRSSLPTHIPTIGAVRAACWQTARSKADACQSSRQTCSWSMRFRRTSSQVRRCCAGRSTSSAHSSPEASAARSIAGSASRWPRAAWR
jgi:Metallo-beta-lactamase superfamily